MPEFTEYTIGLKLHHPAHDPARLTEVFGWSARPSWVAGAPRRDAAGRPLKGVHRSSYAAVAFRHSKRAGMPDSVQALLAMLEQRRTAVRRWVRSGGRLEVWVSVYAIAPAGDTLRSGILGRCAALDVDLCLLVSPIRMPEHLNERPNRIRVLAAGERPVRTR